MALDILLRSCRPEFVALNQFIAQESRFPFEIVEDSLLVFLFVVLKSWIHVIGSVSEHVVEDTS
jgi:hypothetical protein